MDPKYLDQKCLLAKCPASLITKRCIKINLKKILANGAEISGSEVFACEMSGEFDYQAINCHFLKNLSTLHSIK
jgi:hypothetical protein